MSPIDRYLHDLAHYLPRHACLDILPEIRSHLLELAADWQRRGMTAEQSQARAIAQFGEVRTIGRQLRIAHGIVGWGDVALAAVPVLGITGLGWHFVGQHMPLWWYLLAELYVGGFECSPGSITCANSTGSWHANLCIQFCYPPCWLVASSPAGSI